MMEGKTFGDFADPGTESVYTGTTDEKGFPEYAVQGGLKDVSQDAEFKKLGFAEDIKYLYPVKLNHIGAEDSVKVEGTKTITKVGESEWLLGVKDNSTTFKISVNDKPLMKLTFANTKLNGGE